MVARIPHFAVEQADQQYEDRTHAVRFVDHLSGVDVGALHRLLLHVANGSIRTQCTRDQQHPSHGVPRLHLRERCAQHSKFPQSNRQLKRKGMGIKRTSPGGRLDVKTTTPQKKKNG